MCVGRGNSQGISSSGSSAASLTSRAASNIHGSRESNSGHSVLGWGSSGGFSPGQFWDAILTISLGNDYLRKHLCLYPRSSFVKATKLHSVVCTRLIQYYKYLPLSSTRRQVISSQVCSCQEIKRVNTALKKKQIQKRRWN